MWAINPSRKKTKSLLSFGQLDKRCIIELQDHVYYRWPQSPYRQSTDYRLIVDRQIGRQWTDISADSPPINVHIWADASADSRSIYRSTISRLSTNSRSIVDRQSTDGRPINVYILGDALVDCWLTVGQLSVNCQPIVGRLLTDS